MLGLFAVVATAHAHGLGALLAQAAGIGRRAGVAAPGRGGGRARVERVNNLPAYLALEPAAGTDPLRVAALLIGTGVGPLITPWGSLATRPVVAPVPAR